MTTYYIVDRDGQYLTPDWAWTADEDSEYAPSSESDAAAAAAQYGGVVRRVDYTPPPPRSRWDQARSCWVGENDVNADVASIVDAAIGTAPHTR